MSNSIRRFLFIPGAIALVGSLSSLAVASDTDAIATSETPIVTALGAVDRDVLRYNDHLTTLASPYMAGRLPGTDGMERAKQYVEFWFTEFGLEPAFTDEEGEPTFRQPFDLGGTMELTASEASFKRGLRRVELVEDEDYIATSLGASGSVSGPMVFVGYGVESGPDDYTNFEGLDDLNGRIAVMFRFEPMDEEGQSLFQEGRGWSSRAGFRRKLQSVFDRGAAGVIIINPPGSGDPRADSLQSVGGGGGGAGPVLMLSQQGGEKLMERFDPERRSLMDVRRFADTEGGWFDMDGRATIEATFERKPTIVENVGGLIPGRGSLADEVIVIGAHLDHLGLGYFGSRSGPGELHAGADDNASGSAGVLLMAEKLKEAYDTLPDDADARTLKLVLFTAEESGLNGSRYLANNPEFPIEDHMLMINFDMIGRIQNNRLSVSGMNTGEGLLEFCQPFFDNSGLDCIVAERMSGASDHTSYYDRGVPVLFAIIEDFHQDYHTPADVSEKINRVGATKTARLFTEIALAAAQRSERFEFTRQAPRQRQQAQGDGGGGRMDLRVRFGVQPSYTEDLGVAINAVTDGGSAALAGVEAGDILVRWDGQKIENIEAWMGMLSKHSPGDVVKIGVKRGDEEITLEATLQER
ncbi:MAG: hypothetical protein Tsb0013_06230 [Phycisphaerales bacterium]